MLFISGYDLANAAIEKENISDDNDDNQAGPKRAKSNPFGKTDIIKQKRLKGEGYTNIYGKERKPRTIGPPCSSTFCLRSSLRNCQSFDDEQRTKIFKMFWEMDDWKERKAFVCSLVNEVGVLIRIPCINSSLA